MTKEQEPITWIVGKDNCQVAVRNMPTDKMQKICAIIGEEKQQSCEDCISRDELESVISELTYWHPTTDGRLEVGGALENTVYKVEDVWRLTRVLPSVTPRMNLVESSQDCISREAAIDVVVFECGEWTGLAKEINKQLRQLPPVTPRPKGKWIQTKDDCDGVNFYDFSFECSKCGKERSFKSNYCPNCGAYMRESEVEE